MRVFVCGKVFRAVKQVNESVLLPVLKAIGYTVQTKIKAEK